MTEIIVISVLSLSSIVFGFTTWNLLRKNEATEDVVEEQEELIANIASRIDDSMKKMKQLDTRGAFEADDETGTVFKQLYEVIEKLETYYAEETKEEE
jgi:hypothetical protein|tara:strand:- start:419 stop:712 length:294 start_codon:yes stop_codon:yes gene_type:complete